MSVTILSTTILSVIITSDNVNWVQFNRGTEICSVRLRPDKAGAILVYDIGASQRSRYAQSLTIRFTDFVKFCNIPRKNATRKVRFSR